MLIVWQDWPVKGGYTNTLDVHSNDLLITGSVISCISVVSSLCSNRPVQTLPQTVSTVAGLEMETIKAIK